MCIRDRSLNEPLRENTLNFINENIVVSCNESLNEPLHESLKLMKTLMDFRGQVLIHYRKRLFFRRQNFAAALVSSL